MTIDWYGPKSDYTTTASSIKAMAQKYGCHTSTINKKAKKEGWVRFKFEDILKEHEELEHSSTAVEASEVSAGHRVLWNGVKRRLIKGLRSKDVKQGLEELKVAKAAGEVLSNVVKGEKIAWGMEDEPPSGAADEEYEESERLIRKMESLTVPQGTGPSLDGE